MNPSSQRSQLVYLLNNIIIQDICTIITSYIYQTEESLMTRLQDKCDVHHNSTSLLFFNPNICNITIYRFSQCDIRIEYIHWLPHILTDNSNDIIKIRKWTWSHIITQYGREISVGTTSTLLDLLSENYSDTCNCHLCYGSSLLPRLQLEIYEVY